MEHIKRVPECKEILLKERQEVNMWISGVYEGKIFKPLYAADNSIEMANDHSESESDDQGESDPNDEHSTERKKDTDDCPDPGPNYAYGCHTRPVAIFSKAAPFVFTSMVSWPIFWLWRGLDWRNKQLKDVLPFYIRNTYIQAKMIQIGLIAMGIGASLDLARFKRKSKVQKKKQQNNNTKTDGVQQNLM